MYRARPEVEYTGTLQLRPSMGLLYTVKLVYKDHGRDQQNVVLIHRWSLCTGSVTWKAYPEGPVKMQSLWTGGLYTQVVLRAGSSVFELVLVVTRCH